MLSFIVSLNGNCVGNIRKPKCQVLGQMDQRSYKNCYFNQIIDTSFFLVATTTSLAVLKNQMRLVKTNINRFFK